MPGVIGISFIVGLVYWQMIEWLHIVYIPT
jgi:hypothetical protein